MESRHSDSQGTDQGEHKLHQIGHHHRPETACHGVRQHQNSNQRQQTNGVGDPPKNGLPGDKSQGLHHLAQRKEGVTNPDAVDRQSKKECLDSPQQGRCRTAITQLGESSIRENSCSAPQRCKDHGHRHMRQPKAPPLPIAGQAPTADQSRHVEGGVDGEGCGRHRCTGQPAVQTTPGEEIILLTTITSG